MARPSKSYSDYLFLLYYISYGYEFISLESTFDYKTSHVKFTWQNEKKLMDNLLVKDDKVGISFYVRAL
jgi:hypothetical protein